MALCGSEEAIPRKSRSRNLLLRGNALASTGQVTQSSFDVLHARRFHRVVAGRQQSPSGSIPSLGRDSAQNSQALAGPDERRREKQPLGRTNMKYSDAIPT